MLRFLLPQIIVLVCLIVIAALAAEIFIGIHKIIQRHDSDENKYDQAHKGGCPFF